MTTKMATPQKGGFYGWFALAGAMLAGFIGSGCYGSSFGVFLPSICGEFGWSRGVVSAGMSLGLLCFGLVSPLIGVSVTRFGPRANLVFGNLLSALGLAGMSLVQEVWQVYLFYSLAGIGAGFGGYIPATTTVNNWFIRKRSLATGILTAAIGASGFVFPSLATALISSVGWRMAWLVLAGTVFVGASLTAGLILVRNRPEDMGQVPDGVPVVSVVEAGVTASLTGADKEPAGWLTKQALRQPATWLIAAFTGASLFAFNAMTGHQVAYMQDLGFTPVTAALTLSLISGMGIFGSLGFGVLALRTHMNYLASVCFAIRLIALSILLTTNSLALIYVYAVLFGISNGAILAAMPTMLGTYYGRDHFAQILGVIFILQIVGGAIGPATTGAIYDVTNTYTPAFILIAAFSLVGLICAFLARQPELPRVNS
jgi:MFS family permease